MAKINGSFLYIDVNIAESPSPPDWKTICGATSHTLNHNTATDDATTKCSGKHEEHIPTLNTYTIDVDRLMDPTNEYGFEDLLELQLNQTPIQVRGYVRADAERYLTYNGTITSLSNNADMNTVAGWSASIQVNGEPEKSWT